MQVERQDGALVLALYPSTTGLAFVLFESPLSIIDWGKTSEHGRHKNDICVAFVKRLIDRYSPDVIVLENYQAKDTRRSIRVKLLNRSLHVLATVNNIEVIRFRQMDVRLTFAKIGAKTKYDRSRVIASMLPALSHRLPPVRKAWMSEDSRMALFEAAALGLTYYGEPKGE